MNPKFVGDSYDLVKRFFATELASLNYAVSIEPMFTGDWGDSKSGFHRLIGMASDRKPSGVKQRRALFFDPDTGVNESGGKRHVSFARLVDAADTYDLVVSFDQAFSRRDEPSRAMRAKLAHLQRLGCCAMYYDSHARFLFASRDAGCVDRWRDHLVSLGLPKRRLLCGGAQLPAATTTK